jgi:hypothetical protein
MGKVLLILISMMVFFNPSVNAAEKGTPGESQEVDNILKDLQLKASMRDTDDKQVRYEIEYRMLQEKNKIILLVAISAMTVFFMGLTLYFIYRVKNYTPSDIVHGSGLVLVIQAILFVVVFSPTSEQLTASIGALGAIAGYLFGKVASSVPGKGDNQEGVGAKNKG